MYLDYIEENLEKIKDPTNVLCIKILGEGHRRLMVAYVKTGNGEYERVRLCKPKHWTTFPFEPIYHMYHCFGKFYFDNFAILDNMYALNKKALAGFYTCDLENDKSRRAVCANFKDGSSCVVNFPKKKYLEKKYYEILRKLLKENGLEPRYGASTTSDNLIDRFLKDDKAVIPALKNAVKTGKLTSPSSVE